MSNAPVVSVTDELIAELERYREIPSIAALLAERADLKRDAERYRWLKDKQTFIWLIQDWFPGSQPFTDVDAAIDAAMQS